jgi:hypothetical protein
MGGPFFLQATEPQKVPKKDIRVILHALTAGHLVTKPVTRLLLSEFHFFASAKNAKTLPGLDGGHYTNSTGAESESLNTLGGPWIRCCCCGYRHAG